MCSFHVSFFITFLFFSSTFFFNPSQQSLFSPVSKDTSSGLYSLKLDLKTPLQPAILHLDLGSYLPFYDCSRHYKSSTYQPVYSNSTLCTDLNPGIFSNCFRPPGPGCVNDSCSFFPENPVTRKIGIGELLIDKFALQTAPNILGPVSELLFSCTDPNEKIYRGLAKGSTGLAALSRFNYSLPAQVSQAFSSPEIFAVCLPAAANDTGFVLFNSNSSGPYYFSPLIDISKSLVYTPLILGPVGVNTQIYYWYKSPDYYIGLTSIRVNQTVVPLNRTLLAIDANGKGGTRISSSEPYAVLQTSILNALVNAFEAEAAASHLVVIQPLTPFKVCFAAEKVSIGGVGPSVPTIDLVLQDASVVWRIYGSNSMVRITGDDGVDRWCLGFVDGGATPSTPIVIGGLQMENNLLVFDLENPRLGFSSSLLSYGTTCNQFRL